MRSRDFDRHETTGMKRRSFILLGIFLLAMGLVGDVNSAGDAEAAKAKLPLCVGCHGTQGEGKEPVGDLPAYPALAGQIEAYLVKSVTAYKNDERVDPVMSAIAKALSDEDIANMAAYFAALGK